ncbi:MAG: Gldg family protein [Clostridia bacterium]|nr:Gldg family protein [Clostridia bacterium]
MKYQVLHSRRAKYGGLTVSLTVVLIAAVVLLNVMFSTLAYHYSWYIDMTAEKVYSVSDECKALIGGVIDKENDRRAAAGMEELQLEILFASDYNAFEQGSTSSYIYNTARELELEYPDTITVSWFDCWVDKKLADELGVTASTDVVLRVADGESRAFGHREFFMFSQSDSSTPTGYGGDRCFASGLVYVLNTDRPTAYFTINHDEIFYDSQILLSLRDAGYNISMLDLYFDDIPEDCEVLVIFNPNADLIVADGVSERDELDKLDRFLSRGGSLMVFYESDTPTLTNMETLLSDWGVSVLRDYDEETERYYNCMVKDDTAALTSDGFTILGEYVTESPAADVTAVLRERDYVPRVVFRDATTLSIPEGYASSGVSTYVSGTRTRSDLFVASTSAVAYANGSTVPTDMSTLPLLTLTEDSATGGQVVVCSSVEFALEDYMQSIVFGNNDMLLCLAEKLGSVEPLLGLKFKPFTTDEISLITTAQMRNWTLALTITPAVLVIGAATIILVRRKYA